MPQAIKPPLITTYGHNVSVLMAQHKIPVAEINDLIGAGVCYRLRKGQGATIDPKVFTLLLDLFDCTPNDLLLDRATAKASIARAGGEPPKKLRKSPPRTQSLTDFMPQPTAAECSGGLVLKPKRGASPEELLEGPGNGRCSHTSAAPRGFAARCSKKGVHVGSNHLPVTSLPENATLRLVDLPFAPAGSDLLNPLPCYQFERDDDTPLGRQYKFPFGWGRSSTTILGSTQDKSGLESWAANLDAYKGEGEAEKVRDLGAFRGTRMHWNIENYILTGEVPEFSFLHSWYWDSIFPFVQQIRHTVLMEGTVYHPYGFGGTLDHLGYLHHKPGLWLNDWKSADSSVLAKPEKVYEYKLQGASYWAAALHTYKEYNLDIRGVNVICGIAGQLYEEIEVPLGELEQLFVHFKARCAAPPWKAKPKRPARRKASLSISNEST